MDKIIMETLTIEELKEVIEDFNERMDAYILAHDEFMEKRESLPKDEQIERLLGFVYDGRQLQLESLVINEEINRRQLSFGEGFRTLVN